MSTLEGTASDYREHPEGSRQFVRFVDGEPVGPSTWVAEGLEFPAVFERRNNPPAPILIAYGVFRGRWEPTELQGLFAAKNSDWRVEDYVTLASAQGHVNLSGPTAAAAKALFVDLEVLTPERAAAIFAAD